MCPRSSTMKRAAPKKLCNEKGPLYLETDKSGTGLRAGLLQMRDRMWMPNNEVPDNTATLPTTFSNSLISTEMWYINIKREAHCDNRSLTTGLNFQEECSNSVTKATKRSAAYPSKQHKDTEKARTTIIYSRLIVKIHNHYEGKDEEIPGMSLNIHTVEIWAYILEYMMAGETKHATQYDNYLSKLLTYVIHGWPSTLTEIRKDYSHFGHLEMT